MPAMPTIMRWARDNEAFREQYARAMEQRADFWGEELLEIADDGRNDWMERQYGDTTVDVPNPEVVARSKLRVETRKWLMGKAAPKKYSDKLDLSGSLKTVVEHVQVYVPDNKRDTTEK